jgi:chemotaxis family two-component system sensor kinase Cph1
VVDEGKRLPAPVETTLFRIVQEAVNNVLRHAQAQHVQVILTRDDDHVQVHVADDGRGFDVQRPRSGVHIGLWSMRERVEQLGGRFEVRSAPGQGTTVTAVVPL